MLDRATARRRVERALAQQFGGPSRSLVKSAMGQTDLRVVGAGTAKQILQQPWSGFDQRRAVLRTQQGLDGALQPGRIDRARNPVQAQQSQSLAGDVSHLLVSFSGRGEV